MLRGLSGPHLHQPAATQEAAGHVADHRASSPEVVLAVGLAPYLGCPWTCQAWSHTQPELTAKIAPHAHINTTPSVARAHTSTWGEGAVGLEDAPLRHPPSACPTFRFLLAKHKEFTPKGQAGAGASARTSCNPAR